MTESLIGKIILSRYKVLESLGRGGMAEVYKVWDQERSAFLAMKVLRQDIAQDPIFLRRFQREGKNLSMMQHPSIVRFYGLQRDDLLAFLLMEYVEGVSLQAEILRANGKPFSDERILEIFAPVCSALSYAHRKGLVHCDIKPGNILIEKGGRVLLTDFGIARTLDTATATMMGAGTPAYMAPELVIGQDPTPQSDIYSLGIVLYEMLTGGERPFIGDRAKITGTTAEKVRWEQVNLAPVPPSKYNKKVSPQFEAVVLKCLEKDPKKRFSNSRDLLSSLENPQEIMTSDQESDAGSSIPQRKKRYGWLAGIGLILIGGFLLVKNNWPSITLSIPINVSDDSNEQIMEINTLEPAPTSLPAPTSTATLEPTVGPVSITTGNIEQISLINEIQIDMYSENWRYSPLENSINFGTYTDRWVIYSFKLGSNEIIRKDSEEDQLAGFSDDGELTIYKDTLNKFIILNNQSNEVMLETANLGDVLSYDISSDNQYFAVGRNDGSVLLWSVPENRYFETGMSHGQTGRNWIWGYDEKQDKWTGSFQSPVMGLDFSPAQSHLASGGNDTLVWIWEVPSGKPITSLNAHKQGIAKLLFTPDGKYLVTAGQDHKIFIWDAMTYDLLNECDYLIEPFLDSFNTIMLGTNYRGDILYFYGYQSFEDLTANNKDPGTVYFVDLPGCQLVHKIDDKTIKQVFFTTNDEELILVHDDHIEEYQIR